MGILGHIPSTCRATVTPLLTMFVDVALSAPYVTLSAAKGLLLLEEEILRRLRLLRMT